MVAGGPPLQRGRRWLRRSIHRSVSTRTRTAEPEAQPKRRSRLKLTGAFMLPAFIVFGLLARGWDSTHHDHEGPHGAPASAAMLEQEMSAGPFTADDGTLVGVQGAACTGQGEALLRRLHALHLLARVRGRQE